MNSFKMDKTNVLKMAKKGDKKPEVTVLNYFSFTHEKLAKSKIMKNT